MGKEGGRERGGGIEGAMETGRGGGGGEREREGG